MLASLRLYPQIYKVSAHARIEAFIQGTELTPADLNTEPKLRLVAQYLAKIHYLQLPQLNSETAVSFEQAPTTYLVDVIKSQGIQNRLWSALGRSNLSSQQKSEIASILSHIASTELLQELSTLLKESHTPIILAHNDLNNTNMLYNELKDQIHIIDYEFAGLNYRAFEFGNFFSELQWTYSSPTAPYFEVTEARYPSESAQKDFFSFYLLAK